MSVSNVWGGAPWSVPRVGQEGDLELKVGRVVVGKGAFCRNVTGEATAWHETVGLTTRFNLGTEDNPKMVRVLSRSIGFASKDKIEKQMKAQQSNAETYGPKLIKALEQAKYDENDRGSLLKKCIEGASTLNNNNILGEGKSRHMQKLWMGKDKDGNFDVLVEDRKWAKENPLAKENRWDLEDFKISEIAAGKPGTQELRGKNLEGKNMIWTFSSNSLVMKEEDS